MSGIGQVELGARILVLHSDDSVDVRFISCGWLRCSAAAAAPGANFGERAAVVLRAAAQATYAESKGKK